MESENFMEDNAYWYFLIEDTQTLIRSSLSYASRVRLGATCKTERLIMGQWLLKHAYESFCWDLGNENIIGFEASIFRRYKRRRADNPLHPITMKYVWDGKNPLFHENSNLSIVEAIGSDSILISKQKHIYKYHRSLAADNDIVAIKQLIENYKWLKGRSINSFNPVSLILGAIKADNWELIECLSAWFAESFEFDITQSMWVRLMGFDELKQNINFMAMNGLEVTMG